MENGVESRRKPSAEQMPYWIQKHAVPGTLSQYSTRQDFGLCASVHADPWMKYGFAQTSLSMLRGAITVT